MQVISRHYHTLQAANVSARPNTGHSNKTSKSAESGFSFPFLMPKSWRRNASLILCRALLNHLVFSQQQRLQA